MKNNSEIIGRNIQILEKKADLVEKTTYRMVQKAVKKKYIYRQCKKKIVKNNIQWKIFKILGKNTISGKLTDIGRKYIYRKKGEKQNGKTIHKQWKKYTQRGKIYTVEKKLGKRDT